MIPTIPYPKVLFEVKVVSTISKLKLILIQDIKVRLKH